MYVNRKYFISPFFFFSESLYLQISHCYINWGQSWTTKSKRDILYAFENISNYQIWRGGARKCAGSVLVLRSHPMPH